MPPAGCVGSRALRWLCARRAVRTHPAGGVFVSRGGIMRGVFCSWLQGIVEQLEAEANATRGEGGGCAVAG